MPFTPSHAIVALPFIRTPLVPAAIAVGAMTPDLPLFVRGLPLHYGITHDLTWLPATILLALVLLLVWRCVLRPAARELSPTWLAARFPSEWDRGAVSALAETFFVSVTPRGTRRVSWRGVALLLISLVVGVASHILWDVFTHEGRGGVDSIPALAEQWGPLLGYKWLQHGSSVLGLVILGVWMLLWLRRADVQPNLIRVTPAWLRWGWLASLPIILITAWMLGLALLGPLTSDFTVAHLAYRVLPPACALWGLETLLVAIVVQVRRGLVGR
ncbi:DUF4184 family protein (plasmid) [Coraliomargarita sp. W4R53]